MASWRRINTTLTRLAAATLLWQNLAAAASTPSGVAALERYAVGDVLAPRPDPVQPGLLLIGGGDHDPNAMRWFLERAGHGRIVVLRASMSTDVADEMYRELGGATAVHTYVFHSRTAATDPQMLQDLALADGIFIAGGDQSRYVRFWKNTPVAAQIDAHVAAGRPLAGTSAGLAILGEYLFSAMTPPLVSTASALQQPISPEVTIDHDFLHFDVMHGYLTDSHFDRRHRLGRLVAFITIAQSMAAPRSVPIEGLGIDETAALAVLPNGDAQVFSQDPHIGATWVHDVTGTPIRGKPLTTGKVSVTDLGLQSRFNLRTHHAENPREERIVRILDGQVEPQ
jgi:beta-aspartyl-peptidase (threonine type)